MRAYHRGVRRGIMVAVVLSLGFSVAGCESLPDFENMFNTKKKLPGERKEVFPGGVPGVTQGVPQEYMKGNQAAVADPAATPAAVAAPAEAAPPPEEPKPKPKPKPRVAAKPKPVAAPAEQQPQQQPAAQSSRPAQAGGSPWPDAPATGTFSR